MRLWWLILLLAIIPIASAADNGQLASNTTFNFSDIGVNITVLAPQNFSQIQYPASPPNTLEFTINGRKIQFNSTTDKTLSNISHINDVFGWKSSGSGFLVINTSMQYKWANYSYYNGTVLISTHQSDANGNIIITTTTSSTIQREPGTPALISPINQSTTLITTLPLTQSFAWSNEGSSQYNIVVSTVSDFSTTYLNMDVATNNAALSITQSGTFYWKVRTFDGISTYGSWSTVFQFTVNQGMLPTGDGSTGIQGIVYENTPTGNKPVSGATVTITNGTWFDSMVTDSTGLFRFTGLVNYTGSTITSTSTTSQSGYVVNTSAGNTTYPGYVVNTSGGNTTYPGYVVNTSGGSTTHPGIDTTTTTTQEPIQGIYYLQAKAPYYIDTSVIPVTTSAGTWVTQFIYIQKCTIGSYLCNLPAVRFMVSSVWGTRYENVVVTVYKGTDTTQSSVLSGITGADGSVVFGLIKDQQYTITFIRSPDISKTWTSYFTSDFYIVTVAPSKWTSGAICGGILANLTQTPYNATFTTLGLNYSDPSGKTTLVNFFVQDVNRTYLYTASSTASVYLPSFKVNSSVVGTTYYWGYNATSTSCTDQLQQTKSITFKGSGRLIDLGLQDTSWYNWISVILITFTAALFSIKNVKKGAVITPIFAGILYGFGWFSVSPIILGSAITLGILVYMRSSEIKVAY